MYIKGRDIMATKKKSSKKGLASASKKTRTKVARKGGKSQEKNKEGRKKEGRRILTGTRK